MKIYFNRKPVGGPWGGGNKTLMSLINKLKDDQLVPVGDILRERAIAENRVTQAQGFVENEIDLINKQKVRVYL